MFFKRTTNNYPPFQGGVPEGGGGFSTHPLPKGEGSAVKRSTIYGISP